MSKCISVEEILKKKEEFFVKVKELRRGYLVKDLNLLTKNQQEMKLVFCSTLAYFLIQDQIDKLNPDFSFGEELLSMFQKRVTEHCLEISKYGYTSKDVLSLKKILHFCSYACKKKGLLNIEAMYLESSSR